MIRVAAGIGSRPGMALWSRVSAELPGIRLFSRAARKRSPIPETQIKDYLSLKKSRIKPLNTAEKHRLVLLLVWLGAKKRHLRHLERFYLDQGCDILTVRIRPLDILLPETGAKVVASNVVKFIQSKERREQQLIVHGFSGGVYLYTEILQIILAEKQSEVTLSRIVGQIYDSLVTFSDIPTAVSEAVFKNNVMQTIMRKSLELFQRMTHGIAGKHHQQALHIFHTNPVKAPSLFFYSDRDPISSAVEIKRMMSLLKDKMGHTSVEGKEFTHSSHVGHMRKYPEEYISTLRSFLKQND